MLTKYSTGKSAGLHVNQAAVCHTMQKMKAWRLPVWRERAPDSPRSCDGGRDEIIVSARASRACQLPPSRLFGQNPATAESSEGWANRHPPFSSSFFFYRFLSCCQAPINTPTLHPPTHPATPSPWAIRSNCSTQVDGTGRLTTPEPRAQGH